MARLKPVTQLEGHLGFWLWLVSNQVSRGFEEALADANDAAFFKALSVGERKTLEAALRKIAAGFRAAPFPID